MKQLEVDKTRLSYWFPKLSKAGLPVPETLIVPITAQAQDEIWNWLDGKPDTGAADAFIAQLTDAAQSLGLPCFLRTDHTSGKHSWKDTCYLADVKKLKQHVHSIVEFSACADFIGLPWDMWAVRGLLPTQPYGFCPSYGNMPINKEFRFFVKDGDVQCWHPYWPSDALQQGRAVGPSGSVNYGNLCRMDDENELSELASEAGKAVGGSWSVDILETSIGWYVTDMAEAHKSFHWEGCKLKSA